MPNNVPSLCIPRVFPNIDEKRVRRIFNDLNIGDIKRIDIITKTTDKGDKFNRIFIHFNKWFSNENADMSRERLLNGKEIKIIYDDPWFWKVSAYREPTKPKEAITHNNSNNVCKKAVIRFEEELQVEYHRQESSVPEYFKPKKNKNTNKYNKKKENKQEVIISSTIDNQILDYGDIKIPAQLKHKYLKKKTTSIQEDKNIQKADDENK